MRILTLLLALLLMAGCSGCVSVPSHNQLRETTLRLRFEDGICSGTAIAKDVILTAKHCQQGGALVSVNNHPVKVVGVGANKHDTMTLRVTGIEFKRWAKLGHPPSQGDRIRWWGNPKGLPDVYREGYVSRAWSDGAIYDATICQGDSGAGLFNAKGEVVGVVSGMNDFSGCTFMFGYPMGRT